jgi:hypothetical protein
MTTQFTYQGTLVTVEDGILPNLNLDTEILQPSVSFRDPASTPNSSIEIRYLFEGYEIKTRFKQIVTKWTRITVDTENNAKSYESLQFAIEEGAVYYEMFANMRTPQTVSNVYVNYRACINNLLENLWGNRSTRHAYFNGVCFCFLPQAGYLAFTPIDYIPHIQPATEDEPGSIQIIPVSENSFEYTLQAVYFETVTNNSGLFQNLPAGEYTLTIKDLTQTAAFGGINVSKTINITI